MLLGATESQHEVAGSGGSTDGVVIMKRTRPRDETAEITSAAGMVPRSRTRPIQ